MKNRLAWINYLTVVAILLVLNALGRFAYYRVDLTEDKRFTLTKPTVNLLSGLEVPVQAEVLLEGQFPAGFKRLQNGVHDVLKQFKNECPQLEIVFTDPNEGNLEQVNATRQLLAEQGIVPTNLRVNDGTEMKEKLIYPYVLIKVADKVVGINILENSPGFDQEQNLNNSLNLLEYKLADAIQKLMKPASESILFTTGHGELSDKQTLSLEAQLRKYYLTDRVPLDSTIQISGEARVLIVAKPTQPFSDRDKFILDQYIMNGGRVIWLIDQVAVNMDSLGATGECIPPPMDHNLDDLFFKYGFRINKDLVLDLECTRIPQVIGSQGGKPQIELFPWYYHPLSMPTQNHPISKNVGRVNLFFPSSIDTIKTATPVKKTVLLTSGEYSRRQMIPTRLNFEILRYEPDPDKFNMSYLPQGVLLEGKFPSLFANKVSEEMLSTFDELGIAFKKESRSTKMVVFSDGDLAKNLVGPNDKPMPLGQNKWENFTFPGNSDLILNTVEYLMDDTGLLQARSKDVKLRLLDKVRCQDERTYWQLFNILLPLVLLGVFGVGFNIWRRKKYTA